jgi:ketosteroid isomerase-like protein
LFSYGFGVPRNGAGCALTDNAQKPGNKAHTGSLGALAGGRRRRSGMPRPGRRFVEARFHQDHFPMQTSGMNLRMRKLLPLTLLSIAVMPALAKDDGAEIKAVVEDRYKEWIAAASKRDAEALTDLYDENAVLMPKQEEPVIGKAAIGEYYRRLVADPHYVPFTETFASNSFHAVDDIAIDTADFDGDLIRSGKQIHFHGKILIVWKKQKDGAWKIFRYMFDEIPAKKL